MQQSKSAAPNPFRLVSHMLAALFNSRTEFKRQWSRYGDQDVKPDEIAGRWIGEWISESSGHHGELKCVLVPVSSSTYRAYFYAAFSRFFRVGYVTELRAQAVQGPTRLTGEEDLGSLAGGTYRCDGEATPLEFRCSYSCKYDHGIFRLRRLSQSAAH